MKKIFFLILVLFSIGLAEDQDLKSETFWSERYVTTDTLKSEWFPIYDSEIFCLYVDYGTAYDSTDVDLVYWLHPGTLTTGDSTTMGFIREDQSGALKIDDVDTTTAVLNGGRLYYSGHYPSGDAVSLARYIQYMLIPGTDHDSLKIDEAKFLKQD